MKPEGKFLKQAPAFWAHVRSISQMMGYTIRGKGVIRVFTPEEVKQGMLAARLSVDHLFDEKGKPSKLCQSLIDYFEYRADVLNKHVKNNLLDKDKARDLFSKLKGELNPSCPLPMNKQKGDKKKEAYLTCIVNMLIEANSQGQLVEYEPRQLTTLVSKDGIPVRTLARWMDGAFPASLNPVAVWEIKEYYYTTTFGSRVADGVYESMLDGLELLELKKEEKIEVLHYLFIDDYYTWWECGRSYLCRLIDILHMGYADEIIFGKEVVERIPFLVKEWLQRLPQKSAIP